MFAPMSVLLGVCNLTVGPNFLSGHMFLEISLCCSDGVGCPVLLNCSDFMFSQLHFKKPIDVFSG